MAQQTYPGATELLITADAGGSNGYRTWLWKRELQRLADETGLKITVCHLPPGTSKWNKIEHRMFCHTYATLRLSKGDSLAAVSKEMGHSSSDITHRTYYKWLPQESTTNIDELDDAQPSATRNAKRT